jgi:hypothetical protein
MTVAATRGLLKPLAPDDRIGWLREHTILRQLEREMHVSAYELQFQREIAGMQFPFHDKEGKVYTHHRESSQKVFYRYLANLQPWVNWQAEVERVEKEEYQKDVDLWENNFGKMDDPEVVAEVDRLVEHLKNPPAPKDE